MDGDKIGPVIRNGRPEKGMPPFDRPDEQIASLVAFIHTQQKFEVRDTETLAGAKAWMPRISRPETLRPASNTSRARADAPPATRRTGDLLGIASRYKGLELEEQMLYPKHAKSKVTVTLASGRDDSRRPGLPG